MNRIIKGLAAASCFSLIAQACLAGDPPPPPRGADSEQHHAMPRHHRGPPSAEEMTRRMEKDLGLSPDQVEQVRAINERHAAQMQKLMPSEEEMRARREQMEKARDEQDAALKAVLSPEQYATLSRQRAEREEHMRGRHHGERPR